MKCLRLFLNRKNLVPILFVVGLFCSCCFQKQRFHSIESILTNKVDSILQLKMSEINAVSGQAIVMDMAGNIKAMVGNGQKQLSSL